MHWSSKRPKRAPDATTIGLERDQIPTIIQTVMDEGRCRFESVHMTAGGDEIPVEVESCRIEAADGPTVVSICHDIGLRKQVERLATMTPDRFRRSQGAQTRLHAS